MSAAPQARIKRFAVVGQPIAHSRSPEIFAVLSAASGIPLTYQRLELSPREFAAAFTRGRTMFDGWNVTAPHKARALAAADSVTPDAQAVGAANVIVFRLGRATAMNTDVGGVRALLDRTGARIRGAATTVLGAGGAARAAVLALAQSGASSITVANRTLERAQALVADLHDAVGETVLLAGDVDEATSVLVNATSDGGAVAASVDACAADGWCIDLQYAPAETPFVRAARVAGRHAIDGTHMLVAQALATFRIWFGDDVVFDPSVEERLHHVVGAP